MRRSFRERLRQITEQKEKDQQLKKLGYTELKLGAYYKLDTEKDFLKLRLLGYTFRNQLEQVNRQYKNDGYNAVWKSWVQVAPKLRNNREELKRLSQPLRFLDTPLGPQVEIQINLKTKQLKILRPEKVYLYDKKHLHADFIGSRTITYEGERLPYLPPSAREGIDYKYNFDGASFYPVSITQDHIPEYGPQYSTIEKIYGDFIIEYDVTNHQDRDAIKDFLEQLPQTKEINSFIALINKNLATE